MAVTSWWWDSSRASPPSPFSVSAVPATLGVPSPPGDLGTWGPGAVAGPHLWLLILLVGIVVLSAILHAVESLPGTGSWILLLDTEHCQVAARTATWTHTWDKKKGHVGRLQKTEVGHAGPER